VQPLPATRKSRACTRSRLAVCSKRRACKAHPAVLHRRCPLLQVPRVAAKQRELALRVLALRAAARAAPGRPRRRVEHRRRQRLQRRRLCLLRPPMAVPGQLMRPMARLTSTASAQVMRADWC